MALVYKDRVKQVCSAPTTTNPFDFTGAATATGYQTFVAALADGDTVIYGAEDADGDWEVGLGTWTEASDQLARTTILASSNAGSAETFSGDTTVYITADASALTANYKDMITHIDGIVPSWTDADTIGWSAGSIAIQGRIYEYTAGNTGNLGAGDAGRSASGVWNHYAYVSSGVIAIELSQTAPTRDTTYGYWTKTGDATRRMVGWHVTNTSNNIVQFWAETVGRLLTIEWDVDLTICRVRATDPGLTWISIDCSTALPACVAAGKFNTKIGSATDNSSVAGVLSPVNTSTTTNAGQATRATFARATGTQYTFFGSTWHTLTTNSIYAATVVPTGTIDGYLLDVCGGKMER